jgi:hypothetical protein
MNAALGLRADFFFATFLLAFFFAAIVFSPVKTPIHPRIGLSRIVIQTLRPWCNLGDKSGAARRVQIDPFPPDIVPAAVEFAHGTTSSNRGMPAIKAP